MNLPQHNYMLLIAQIVTLIMYLLFIFSGRNMLAIYMFGLLAMISIVQFISIKLEKHRLDMEIIKILYSIETHHKYRGLSLFKPLNMDKELQGLRDEIERHKMMKNDG